MISTIIVEDVRSNAEQLQRLIKKINSDIEVVGIADTVKSAISAIKKYSPQLVFLDIKLKDGSGFDVLENIPHNDFEVIFVTAYDKYALKAIKFSAVDYILKPVDIDELKLAIEKVENKITSHRQKNNIQFLKEFIKDPSHNYSRIALPTMEGYNFVPVEDIIRCEADGAYTKFFLTNQRTILASKNLKEFDELLEENNFCRVHHSYLINMNHAVKYLKGDGYVVMSDNSQIEVSKRKREEFLSKLNRT